MASSEPSFAAAWGLEWQWYGFSLLVVRGSREVMRLCLMISYRITLESDIIRPCDAETQQVFVPLHEQLLCVVDRELCYNVRCQLKFTCCPNFCVYMNIFFIYS